MDYARSEPTLLLLDEFDAVAKRRDDAGEVGELKRIVNVLLKELEDWPRHSVLVAATNHPELLDKAIARRFDVRLEVPLPGTEERRRILEMAAGRFYAGMGAGLIEGVCRATEGMNGSEIRSAVLAAVRRSLYDDAGVGSHLVAELLQLNSEAEIGDLIRGLKGRGRKKPTVRELAALFGKSPVHDSIPSKKGAIRWPKILGG